MEVQVHRRTFPLLRQCYCRQMYVLTFVSDYLGRRTTLHDLSFSSFFPLRPVQYRPNNSVRVRLNKLGFDLRKSTRFADKNEVLTFVALTITNRVG